MKRFVDTTSISIVLLCLICVAGCVVNTTEQDLTTSAQKELPRDAKIVSYLGNQWFIFQLNSGERFLYRDGVAQDCDLVCPLSPLGE